MMKSKFFNLNCKTSGLLVCIVLFVLGMVVITSPADTEIPKTDDTGDKVTKPEDKVDKPEKSDKNAAEDFGNGEGDKSDDKPDEKDNQDDEVEDEHPVIPELENETYIELAKIGKLDEKQQKLLVRIQKKRSIALERWDKTNEKELEKKKRKAAGEEKESRRAKLELKVTNFEALRDKLEASFDTKARKVCKLPQLVDYNAKIIYRAAMDEFDGMQLQLSDEEALKVKKVCAELARKKYRNPGIDLTRNKKAQFQGIYAVAKNVLTKEQLKKFKKVKRQEEREKQRSMQRERGRTTKGKKSRHNR